jgi:branched-chain amino acid transport system ATP-binding protein
VSNAQITQPAGEGPTPPAVTPLLACADIKAGYEQVTIVRAFNLDAHAGSVVAVLGPNGAGKTTLLTTLAGLLPAQDGTITLAGQPLKHGRPATTCRAGLVLVPDDRALFRTMSVEENLKAASGKRKKSIDSVIDVFPQLGTRRKVAAGNLSGGEQQMLAVGRALMQEPRVLLLDEMSMGLAPVIVEELLPMVRRIADETNAVVVLVEQHVSLALEIADRAMILVHGEVILDRPAEELRADPTMLEAAYLGETPHTAASNGQASSTSTPAW